MSSSSAAALGAGLLVLLPLVSYALRASHAGKAARQLRETEEAQATSERQQAREGIRLRMRQWYQAYDAAVQTRDALGARLKDPDEELQNLFSENALQDPNNPTPNRRDDLRAQYDAAVTRAQALHAEGEALKRDFDALGGDETAKPKAD